MKVLLSIKPEFVQEILQERKKYEYRKAIFQRSVDKVVVYSTKPVGMIVGEFTVENIPNDTPSILWDQTHKDSGITKDFLTNDFERSYTWVCLENQFSTFFMKNQLIHSNYLKAFAAPPNRLSILIQMSLLSYFRTTKFN